MYVATDAHPLTVIIIVGTLMVTPIYVFATYVFSGASRQKGMGIGIAALVVGAFMFWVCLSGLPNKLGLLGNLIVPAAWVLPSLALFLLRKWFLAERLSQKWLVGLQLFRVIGALFLLEMAREDLPGIFAYPAGIGMCLPQWSPWVSWCGTEDLSASGWCGHAGDHRGCGRFRQVRSFRLLLFRDAAPTVLPCGC